MTFEINNTDFKIIEQFLKNKNMKLNAKEICIKIHGETQCETHPKPKKPSKYSSVRKHCVNLTKYGLLKSEEYISEKQKEVKYHLNIHLKCDKFALIIEKFLSSDNEYKSLFMDSKFAEDCFTNKSFHLYLIIYVFLRFLYPDSKKASEIMYSVLKPLNEINISNFKGYSFIRNNIKDQIDEKKKMNIKNAQIIDDILKFIPKEKEFETNLFKLYEEIIRLTPTGLCEGLTQLSLTDLINNNIFKIYPLIIKIKNIELTEKISKDIFFHQFILSFLYHKLIHDLTYYPDFYHDKRNKLLHELLKDIEIGEPLNEKKLNDFVNNLPPSITKNLINIFD